MTVPEAAAKYNIKENTIRVKSRRNKWVTPRRVAAVLRNRDHAAIAKVAKDWLAEGEKHREKVFDIATNSLKRVKKITVRNAKDFEIVDKAARRAAGLETADTQIGVLIQMNERMENFEDEQPVEADAIEVEATVTPVEPVGPEPASTDGESA
jgi:nucleoid DNA-binding protein